jgi:cytoskeletal protein RodZ
MAVMAGRHRRSTEPRPARGRWLAIVGTVIVVVVLAVVLPLLLLGNDGNGKPTAGDSPRPHPSPSSSPSTSASATSAAPSTTSPAASSTSATTSPPAARTSTTPPPTLLVHADRAASWLIVSDARGHIRFNALVPRGDSQSFTGPFFHVTIGYPPGVIVTVNGQRRPRGGAGHLLIFDVRGR